MFPTNFISTRSTDTPVVLWPVLWKYYYQHSGSALVLLHKASCCAGSGPGSRRPDSFMSPKSSISTPVEDIPGASRIPNLAGLGSKVAGLQQTAHQPAQLDQGRSETRPGPSTAQHKPQAAQAGLRNSDQNTSSRARVQNLQAKIKPGNAARSDGTDGASEEEHAVVAAGAAAMMSSHALSALDLFVGGSARQVGSAPQDAEVMPHHKQHPRQCLS